MSVKELLSKDVSLKNNTYPSKKTMNFVENNEAKNNRTALIVFGVFLVFLVLFTKFGVIDRISETNALMSQYQTNSKQLDALKEELKDYDAIEEKYNALVGSFLSEGERNCLNRTDLLKMIDEDIPCEDILSQINAAKSALHTAGQVVLEGHIKHCVRDGLEHGDPDKTIENFTKAVERFAMFSISPYTVYRNGKTESIDRTDNVEP